MPCIVETPSEQLETSRSNNDELRSTNKKLEAALCAALTKLESLYFGSEADALSSLDYREAGVSKAFVTTWWRNHKVRDAKRRKEEAKKRTALEAKKAEEKEHAALIRDAVKNLTPQQVAALVGDSAAAKSLRHRHRKLKTKGEEDL